MATRKSLTLQHILVDSLTNWADHWRAGGCVVTGIRSRARAEVSPRAAVFLIVAAALAIPSNGADARHHLQASQDAHHSAPAEGYSPPSASIVVDGNTGKVLQESNPDAPRHPASLTKIMTLYLLFERLDLHKIKLDTPLNVSAKAAEQPPSTLGLKAGQTIAVEDVIKAVVTRSANDAAVVIAENLSGDEGRFAKLMTHKAHALGMSRTTYVNASGLPNDDQITTARDQALLGRAIQERYPSYYKYFSIQSFEFRGEAIQNHNHLLGSIDGVDGIKTGFTRASGFNLVTSVHRDGHYIVAVVLGGRSALERDAHMRELVNAHINDAGLRRTSSVFAERPHRKPQVLGFAKSPPSSGADSTLSTPLRAGSSDPTQSLPVKTISYHAAPSQAAALASMLLAAATLQPVAPAARAQSNALSTIADDRFTAASTRGPPGANTGEILERVAREDARSQTIQPAIVREVPPEKADTSTFAKSETNKLTRAEMETRTTDDTSTVESSKRTDQSPAVTALGVSLVLSLGLLGVSLLAWRLIKDTALGGPLNRAGDLSDNNERPVTHFDDRRQADWLDDFLANWRQSLTERNSVFASARKA